MEITDKLKDGIQLDLMKPLTDEIKEAFHVLLGNDQNYMFHYEKDSWIYWNGSEGEFKKDRIQKYNTKKCEEQKRIKREYMEHYKYYTEMEYIDDQFINIGSQVISCEENGKKYIRIVPYGIRFDETMYLEIGNNAYYVVYDMESGKVELGFLDRFDISMIISKEEQEKCLEHPFLQEEAHYYEDMECGYDFGFGTDPVDTIYRILNEHEPRLSCWPFSHSVLEEISMVKRQIDYPIYANPEARERIEAFKSYSPKDFESLGLFPREYELYRFLGISHYPDEKIYISNIWTIRRWEKMIKDNALGEQIRYYTEIREIKIGASNIGCFLDIINETKSNPKDVLNFILRGVTEEGLGLTETLANVKKLVKDGQIASWNGRYSKRVLRKNSMRNTTKINKEILDLLEKKPTLDNLYKQLMSIKEA